MQLQQSHSVTIAMSCAIVGLSRSADDNQPKLADNALMMVVTSANTLTVHIE
ncbi:MAG: hypothetical protein J6568_04760 [Snodgrassella sp.]|nr:hypothetical protein [Snodgrassella sp.]